MGEGSHQNCRIASLPSSHTAITTDSQITNHQSRPRNSNHSHTSRRSTRKSNHSHTYARTGGWGAFSPPIQRLANQTYAAAQNLYSCHSQPDRNARVDCKLSSARRHPVLTPSQLLFLLTPALFYNPFISPSYLRDHSPSLPCHNASDSL